ncbi:MAG: FHA domain-containing protein [Chitinivibrionales bacterium]|nr:FHA domain-containing protein [Chitinivibrionales bacterium]
MQVNLVFLKKDGTTSSFTLPSTVTFIGRRQDCDFCIPLMVVSRRHCEVNMDSGKVTVRDLQSRNGTLVNGDPIEEAHLKAGDVLTIGPVKLVTQIDGVPADFEPYLQDMEHAQEISASQAVQASPDASQKAKKDEQAEIRRRAEQESLEEAVKDLAQPELGGSHTEMLGDFSDFNFDEDFEL